MSNLVRTNRRSALLIAGMHRSGTSALTRVLSYLGADLPEKLAPALPNNNETGFWESVDLMILHDELLKSAGSSWSDWTAFNPDWRKSAVGEKFKSKILSVVKNDFNESLLFVVKDPRVCRFLPFWFDILDDAKTTPNVIIPIRNPLEVAQSLKARDGLPIATGGLIWLRHVLDAIYFSSECPRAIVSYRDLMTDWHLVVESVSAQLGLTFPRQSPLAELDVEEYLDPRQKHNHATLDDVIKCREFSPLLISVYESLLLLLEDSGRVDVVDSLLLAREEFNNVSSQYGKVLYAAERSHQKEVAAHEQQIADYEERLEQQIADYEGRLERESTGHKIRMEQQAEKYDQRHQLELNQHHNKLAENQRDYEVALSALGAAKGKAEYALSATERALKRLRQNYVEAVQGDKGGSGPLGAALRLKRLKKANPTVSLVKSSLFFDADYYTANCSNKEEAHYASAVEHFLSQDVVVDSPHPLFDIEWYLHQYPDVRQANINPLVHFIKYGAKELRQPHPLFYARYYREQYSESDVAGLSPLEHYLEYGVQWGLKPHPLFDPEHYAKQLHEVLDESHSPLIHYLQYKHTWRYSPCAAFDGGWYLDQYLDVAEAGINPLLHYIVRGAEEGRKSHPEFDVDDFKKKFGHLFFQAGIQKSMPGKGSGGVAEQASDVLVVDKRFSRMLEFTRNSLAPESQVFKENNLIIHWVTCDFAPKGGGGNMTIFRFVRLFELAGHEQHIWLHNNPVHHDESAAYEDLIRNYQQTSAQIHFVGAESKSLANASGDIVIATDWESVWPVLSATNFKRRFYFVQDHEPSFFPAGGHSLAAEMTYHEDLDCICAGPWLEQLMQNSYGRWATKFWLAADKSCYFPVNHPVRNKVPRIAFYARRHTERRAVDLGLLALDHLAEKGVNFHVDVYGGDDNEAILSAAHFSFTDHGILDADGLGELYRQCDIGVVFSATNYSLVPQEMMMCGLAVLEMDGENTRTVFPEDVVTLVKPHPENIAEGLNCLLENEEQRLLQADKGRHWATQFDWADEAKRVSDTIQDRLVEVGYERLPSPAQQKYKASVVIPTLNGGELLLEVLQMVRKQKTPWPFEILVIDSGSGDGSLESIGMFEDVQIHAIPKSEFSHGGTRNLGVEMTTGEYIAFLTQDALPADEFWLFNLVSMLEHDAQAAGVFGRHLPYPQASAFVKRDLSAHFSNLGCHPLYLDKNTDKAKFESGDQGWRQVLHFYSDNNSCMRRSVWEEIPYAVIEYGEDQVWADEIIKAGYKKAYAVNAIVYHSHDYNEQENYERSKTEAQFFYEHFGYRLAGSDAEVLRTINDLNKMDVAYGEQRELAEDEIEHQKLLNRSRLKGYQAALAGLLS